MTSGTSPAQPCQALLHVDCNCRIDRERRSEEARRCAVPRRDPSVQLTPSGNIKKTKAASQVNRHGEPDKRAANGGHDNSKKPAAPWKERITEEARHKTSVTAAVAAALDDPEVLDKLHRQLQRSLQYDDFSAFCRAAWHVVEPATDLQWSWHHQLICNTLQALYETWRRGGEVQGYEPPCINTLFNVSPGSLKSRILMVFFPAWCWLRSPSMKFICLSVNEAVTMRDARAARQVINSDWYQEQITDPETRQPRWSLNTDQDAVTNYGNNQGGERLSKASGSMVIGLRCDMLLYDDPNAADETIEERLRINEVWSSALYTRVNSKKSLRIGIQQRVGQDDWSDHVVKKQKLWADDNPTGWVTVVIPAEYDPARKFRMPEPLTRVVQQLKLAWPITEDPRTVAGDPVHPERQSKKDLEGERRRWAGTGHYAAQFLQVAAEQEGTVLKRSHFKFCRLARGVNKDYDDRFTARERPVGTEKNGDALAIYEKAYHPGRFDFDWLVMSVDCALKKTERGSQWAILVMAGQRGRRFILDDRTLGAAEDGGPGGADIEDVLAAIKSAAQLWKPEAVLIEDKAAGDELRRRIIQSIEEGDKGLSSMEVRMIKTGNLGKAARLDTAKPAVINGLIHILEDAAWSEAFLNEVCTYPRGRFDDRVDAFSQCINHFMEDEIGYELPDW